MTARKCIENFHFYDTSELADDEIRLQLIETKPADPQKNRVPSYRFSIIKLDSGEIAGRCDLRVGFNKSIFYSGNIGYHVFEPYRGRHYAAKACKLLLKLAKQHKMPQVVITCRPDNLASRKTCMFLGARFSGVVKLPSDHDLYKDGEREECRYILNFDEFR